MTGIRAYYEDLAATQARVLFEQWRSAYEKRARKNALKRIGPW